MDTWIRWAVIPISGIVIGAIATAVGPLIADKLINRASLSYTTVVSAPVLTAEGPRRVFSASIRNDGSVALTNLRGQIDNDGGTFETVSFQDKKLVSPSIALNPTKERLSIAAPSLLVGDEFTVTVMTLGADDSSLNFAIRSDQVHGTSEVKDQDRVDNSTFVAFVTSTATLAMAGFGLVLGWRRAERRALLRRTLDEDYRRMTSKD